MRHSPGILLGFCHPQHYRGGRSEVAVRKANSLCSCSPPLPALSPPCPVSPVPCTGPRARQLLNRRAEPNCVGQPGRLHRKGAAYWGFEGCLGVNQVKGTDQEATPGRGNRFSWILQASKATRRHLDFIHGWILVSRDEAETGERGAGQTLGN